MALGQNNYNNSNKQYPTVYSNYSMSNTESEIEKSRLSFTFWNNMLKISIAPMKPSTNPNEISFDNDNAGSIYINHIKAKLLYDAINEFQTRGCTGNVGVNSGKGVITISDGAEFNKKTICVGIYLVNQETCIAESSYAYEFKNDYYFRLNSYEYDTGKFEKFMDNNMEIELLKAILISYYEAMSMSMAYSVVHATSFDKNKMESRVESIMSHLGIEFGKSKNYSNNGFNSAKPSGYAQASFDDLDLN